MVNWTRYSDDNILNNGENVWQIGYPSFSTKEISNKELALEQDIFIVEKKLETCRNELEIAKNRIRGLEEQMEKMEEENEKLRNRFNRFDIMDI